MHIRKKVCFLTLVERKELICNAADIKDFKVSARLSLLNNSSQCIKTLISTEKSNLLPAKLLIISRLIYILLSESIGVPAYIETIKEQLAFMRRKLLDRIETKLCNTITDEWGLAEDLTAFSIVTSSTPTDTLEHFLRTRLDALLFSLNDSGLIHECILQGINIFFSTLRQAKLLFRSQLTESFLRIKSRPLLRDGAIRSLQELNLDLYEAWLPAEIQNFTPYIRHDELRKADLEQRLGSWVEITLCRLIERTAARLEDIWHFSAIVKLREDVFRICLSNENLLPSHSLKWLDKMRTIFLSRLQDIIGSRTLKLNSIFNQVRSKLNEWPIDEGSNNVGGWQFCSQKVSAAIEAKAIKRYICEQTYNLDKQVSKTAHNYAKWLNSIAAIAASIEDMKNMTFDDYVNDLNDNQRQSALIQHLRYKDPQILQSELSKSLSDISESVAGNLQDMIRLEIEEQDEKRPHKAAFLLRILREISLCQPTSAAKVPSSFFVTLSNTVSSIFSKAYLGDPLRKLVAWSVIERATESLDEVVRMLKKSKRVPGRCIWDGDPPLPIQPMPQTYQFLRILLQSMTLHGYDIWSPSAVGILKQEIYSIIEATFSRLLADLKFAQKGGTESGSVSRTQKPQIEQQKSIMNDDTIKREKILQLIFEVFYLSKVFDLPNLAIRWRKLRSHVANEGRFEDSSVIARIDKYASDYWKRTYLYFGLLASR